MNVENRIANCQTLCENLQGIVAQRYYVEMLAVDNVVTLTIDDLDGAVIFDADLTVERFDETTPREQRKRIHESVHLTVVGAYRALADAIETNEVEMVNVV